LGIPGTAALVRRVALAIGESPGEDAIQDPPEAPEGPVFRSDTDELVWDHSETGKGVVTVNTPRTKAMAGYVAGRRFDLGGVILAPGETRQDWCTIGIALLEGESFEAPEGATALIVATGDHENTGMVWKSPAKNSVGDRWGTAPVQVEVIPATITLPVPAARVKAWALSPTGERMDELTVEESEGRAQVQIGSHGPTLWYEVQIAKAAEEEAGPVSVSPGPPRR
jgi:hypothetical protein